MYEIVVTIKLLTFYGCERKYSRTRNKKEEIKRKREIRDTKHLGERIQQSFIILCRNSNSVNTT